MRRQPRPLRKAAGSPAVAARAPVRGGRAAPAALWQIDHIVLLMMENRSLDHMAGWLYTPRRPPPRGQRYDGVAGLASAGPVPSGTGATATGGAGRRGASRPVPAGPAPTEGRSAGGLGVWRTTDPLVPGPVSPCHTYPHVNTQLFGTIDPPDGACAEPRPPYNLPPQPPAAPPMSGFALDWATGALACAGIPVTPQSRAAVLGCFDPRTVRVASSLARAYAISDRYFCSVPGPTFCNRSFALAGTSSGLVMNFPGRAWLRNDVPTVFNLLEAAGRTWRIYFDRQDVLPLSWLLLPRVRPYLGSHCSHMPRFFADAAAGRLPAFALVEPRMLVNNNDQHPPHSVLPGERLMFDVYRSLRRSPCWPRTLLIITWDEHGGCFDHVPPPPAVPPDPGVPAGQCGFRFDRLGVRVPLILVSPWARAGTVFRAVDREGREVPLDHTSILRTVTARFGLPSLTHRDAAATDLAGALTLAAPRRDRPLVPPPWPHTQPAGGERRPPDDLLRDVLDVVAAWLDGPPPTAATAGEALALLRAARRLSALA